MFSAKMQAVLAFFAATAAAGPVVARADCKTVTVVSGDSCGSLAKKCNINAANFTKFNPQANLCSTLQIDQRVCCSAGTLPDVRPKPNPDGTCATYVVKEGDWCAKIASANGLSVADIEKFNQNNSEWQGCDNLWVDITICLSTGTLPN